MKVVVVMRLALGLLMMSVSAVEPQFTRFPELPSPPRVIFGGFRPMFRPRSQRQQRFRPPPPLIRSSRRPRFFQHQDQFNRIPTSQAIQGLRPPPPAPPSGRQIFQSTRPAQTQPSRPTAAIRITPPAATMLPPPPRTLQQPQRGSLVIRLPEPSPSPPRVVISSPTQPDARGFGSPKPNSIVSNIRPSSADPSNKGKQLSIGASFEVSNEQSKSTQTGFPRPLPRQNDNNIIGMFPPPPPPVTTTLAPPLVVVQTTPTLPPTSLTSTSPSTSSALTTISNTSPALTFPNPPALISLTSSNSLVNELPLLNAGVLPLAGEDENEHMLFPPFNHLGIPSDLLSDQELFPPFPPNQDLFPPFDST